MAKIHRKAEPSVEQLKHSLDEGQRLLHELLAETPDFFSRERALMQHQRAAAALAAERLPNTKANASIFQMLRSFFTRSSGVCATKRG